MKYLRFVPVVLFLAAAGVAVWYGVRRPSEDSGFVITVEQSNGAQFAPIGQFDVDNIDPTLERYGPRIDDLPPELRDSAARGEFDGGILLVHSQAGLAAAAFEDPDPGSLEPPGSIDRTGTVVVLWFQKPSDEEALAFFNDLLPTDRENQSQRLLPLALDGRLRLQDGQTAEDFERMYDERERTEFSVGGIGDLTRGEKWVTAVLDYDAASDRFRSDRVLYWHIFEQIAFASGRYAVALYRTSYSSSPVPPDDLDLASLARVLYDRLEGAPE